MTPLPPPLQGTLCDLKTIEAVQSAVRPISLPIGEDLGKINKHRFYIHPHANFALTCKTCLVAGHRMK